jgi:hypothetical protein
MAAAAAPRLRRGALSLVVSFKNDAFGMREYEVLSRASACAVVAPRPARLVLLSCLHVVHPFRYPQYFRPDHAATAWVQHVRPEMVRCSAQVVDVGGVVLDRAELRSDWLVPHPVRDLVALRFAAGVDEAQEFLRRNHVRLFDLDRALRLWPGTRVSVEGHRSESRINEAGLDVSVEHPLSEAGAVASIETATQLGQDGLPGSVEQVFCFTPEQLPMGVCGGPVTDAETGDCLAGIVEGIVSKEAAKAAGLETQLAAVIAAQQVAAFVETLPP